MNSSQIILGSQSLGRKGVMSLICSGENYTVCTPLNSDEPGFEGMNTIVQIEKQIEFIATQKMLDVQAQNPSAEYKAIVTADTVLLGFDKNDMPQVLGKPPEADDWKSTVRSWFIDYFFERPHQAKTCVCVANADKAMQSLVVTTTVSFNKSMHSKLDWYLDSEESKGKAGGYALQGLGTIFVDSIEGSPSNVIGLPLRETMELIEKVAGPIQ